MIKFNKMEHRLNNLILLNKWNLFLSHKNNKSNKEVFCKVLLSIKPNIISKQKIGNQKC
jgi:hypothetical protein